MPDTKVSALAALSVPVLDDEMYIVDDPAGTPLSRKIALHRLGGLFLPSVCQGRLTTESGVPVSTSDRTAQGTLYFTPFAGNRVGLYDGTRWGLHAFTELSLALSALTSGKNYDVFLYDNAGTPTLELSAAWTDDTTRADALTTQDGVLVKSGATTRRYLGTIRTTGTTTTEDSTTKRFVWNYYNRTDRTLLKQDTTASWTYTSASWRATNNSSSNRIEVVTGAVGGVLRASVAAAIEAASGRDSAIGMGLDSTTSPVTMLGVYANYSATTTLISSGYAHADIFIPLGYHYVSGMEFGHASGITYYGARTSSTPIGTGIKGVWTC